MITLTREEAQQVLDALDGHSVYRVESAIEFLRARLSAPEPGQTRSEKMREAGITRRPKGWSKEDEPEPVAWYVRFDSGRTDLLTIPITEARRAMWESAGKRFTVTPLYTAQPQREWHGLTDEEIEDLFMENMYCDNLVDFEHIARAIEAKLKELNG